MCVVLFVFRVCWVLFVVCCAVVIDCCWQLVVGGRLLRASSLFEC